MKITPAKRVKAVRELVGLTRQKFGDLVGLDYLRMATLENDRGRMAVDDLSAIDNVFPELTMYLLHGKELNLTNLESSTNELLKFAVMRIRNGDIPEGYGLEEVIVDGRKDQ